jgi:hypothetical protein
MTDKPAEWMVKAAMDAIKFGAAKVDTAPLWVQRVAEVISRHHREGCRERMVGAWALREAVQELLTAAKFYSEPPNITNSMDRQIARTLLASAIVKVEGLMRGYELDGICGGFVRSISSD